MNLVWLWYPEVFWPQDGTNFFGVARDDNELAKFTTFLAPPMLDQHGKRQPILMCQVFGDFAVEIESMSNEDIAAEATAVLRKMFGAEVVKDAIGCVHSSWLSDPFSQCSWATNGTSKDGSSYCNSPPDSLHSSPSCSFDLLHGEGEPEIRFGSHFMPSPTPGIFFAGEATHVEFQGTVHAAYLSGIREGNNIVEYVEAIVPSSSNVITVNADEVSVVSTVVHDYFEGVGLDIEDATNQSNLALMKCDPNIAIHFKDNQVSVVDNQVSSAALTHVSEQLVGKQPEDDAVLAGSNDSRILYFAAAVMAIGAIGWLTVSRSSNRA